MGEQKEQFSCEAQHARIFAAIHTEYHKQVQTHNRKKRQILKLYI